MASVDKGSSAEEALRAYFRSTGYFAVRGIPLLYNQYDVTDVDLWLYIKASNLSAERTAVDVKRKKTPQAMERVLWTRGLKEVLGVERALVVTSDNRAETRAFGLIHGVGILQGEFLQRVIASFRPSERLAEEALMEILKAPCVVDARTDWRRWFRRSKARLLDGMDFDGCNSYLVEIRFLLQEYIATGQQSEAAMRLLYAIIAYFLVCLDHTARTSVSFDTAARAAFLTHGFRYGEAGKVRTEEVVQVAMQLLADAGRAGDGPSRAALRGEFDKQVSEYRAELLGDHFGKQEALKGLFALARAFEEMAYAKVITRPNATTSDSKAVIGLLCDLFNQDRKAVL